MRRWWIGTVVTAGALTLCMSAVAASKTYYASGTWGKAPYISLRISGGEVAKVDWFLLEDCGQTFKGPTHLNAPIKPDGRFNKTVSYSIPGSLGGFSGGTHIWGRLKGATATVTIDDYSSGQSESSCEGRHKFHAVKTAPPRPPAPPTLAFRWSRPEPIQPRGGTALNAVACPSVKLCVAVDSRGAVLTSTTPTRDARWVPRAQDVAPDGTSASLSAVTCAGTSLCVAVDHKGGVLSSTTPARSGSWSRAEADPGYALIGVSCPSRRLCVAIDSGDLNGSAVLSSVDPAAGAGAWTRTYLSRSKLQAISCPSTSLCVIGDYSGEMWASRNPTAGVRAWRDLINVAPTSFLPGSVSCASSSLCVGNDLDGDLVSSTTPTILKARAWNYPGYITRNAPNLTRTDCPSNHLCVAIRAWPNPHGLGPSDALVSRTPTKPRWTRGRVDNAQVNGISCPSTKLCVAVDARGRAILAIGR
jgi:hypothetical protein